MINGFTMQDHRVRGKIRIWVFCMVFGLVGNLALIVGAVIAASLSP